MPPGVSDANACTSAFFAGRAGMMLLSTGSLSFVRDNMKAPYRVAFLPRKVRNAAPIGGASLILPKGNTPERQAAAWTLISWLTSPEIAGEWSRFTGYFAPRKAAYDLPEMKKYLQQHPDAKVALDQLEYAVPWFDTYNTVAVRKAMEDQVQAILSGKTTPADAVVGGAEERRRAAAPLCRADRAEADRLRYRKRGANRLLLTAAIGRIAPRREQQRDVVVRFRLSDAETDRHHIEKSWSRRCSLLCEISAERETKLVAPDRDRPACDQRRVGVPLLVADHLADEVGVVAPPPLSLFGRPTASVRARSRHCWSPCETSRCASSRTPRTAGEGADPGS